MVESENTAASFTYDEALAGLCSVPQNWRGPWLQAAIPGGWDWFASLQIEAWTKNRHLRCQALVPNGARLPLSTVLESVNESESFAIGSLSVTDMYARDRGKCLQLHFRRSDHM